MKIKVNKKHYHGQRLNVPHIGETLIPEDGVLNVKDETIGNWLVEKCPKSFSLPEGETAKISKKTDGNKAKEATKSEVKDELSELSLEDLISIAKESGIKGWQLLAKKPEKLRKFLRKKLKG